MKKRHGAEQIVAKLRQADVELGKGLKVPEVCKQFGITVQTYYRWRQKYGGMAPEMTRQMRGMEKENVRLKKLVAEQALDNQILKEAARRRAPRDVPQGHAPRRVKPAPVGQFGQLARRIAAPPTRSIRAFLNSLGASKPTSLNRSGRPESDAAWLVSALTEAGSGYHSCL